MVDQTCRRCGYNLRGLHRDGRCPECGSPVGLSIKGDLLRFANPDWVERLARGSRFILNGLSAALLAAIVAVATEALRLASVPDAAVEVLDAVCALVGVIGLVVAYVGIWLMTSPDPTRVGEDQYATSRKLVRITLLLGIGNMALQASAGVLPLPQPALTVVAVIGVLTNLAALVGTLAYLQYLKKLSLRIPDEELSKRARFLFAAFLWTPLVWIFVAFLVGMFAALGSIGIGGGVIACTSPLALLAMLVFVLMALRLQHRMGRACGQQAKIARETWASGGANLRSAATPTQTPE